MPPDIEKYRKHLDRFSLTEEQKVEVIHTVWTMMESFVDQAFGLHSVQLSRKGKARDDANHPENGLDSELQLTSHFDRTAGHSGEGKT